MQKDLHDYYNNVPEASKLQLKRLHYIVKKLLPTATVVMNYGIPTFKINGKSIVGIGGWNNFVSLYPYGHDQIRKFQEELKAFKTTRGAIQFPLNKALPKKVITKIIKDKIKSYK